MPTVPRTLLPSAAAAATKPEDWDDEEDGDWEAPKIANPKVGRGS